MEPASRRNPFVFRVEITDSQSCQADTCWPTSAAHLHDDNGEPGPGALQHGGINPSNHPTWHRGKRQQPLGTLCIGK